MKIIFLDIDGVLNANDDFGGRSKSNPTVDGWAGISLSKVKRLAKIVNATEAKIVLVSSWKKDYVEYLRTRCNHVGKYLRNKLRRCSLEIIDTTLRYEKCYGGDRGNGIKSYLKEHKDIENWIILDDEIFKDYDEFILCHLIKTDEKDGLTDLLVQQAIDILNK